MLLLVDDHTLFRKTLANALTETFTNTIVYDAENGNDAITIIKENPIQLVIMDVQMPEMDGIMALKIIKKNFPGIKVVMLTQFDECSLISHLFKLGADGFLIKNCELEDLVHTIRKVLSGDKYYHYNLSFEFPSSKNAPNLEFSPREIQLLNLLNKGKSNKEIASILNLTINTIESYRKALMKKTKTRNVAELIRLVHRTGLVK